LIYMGSKLVHNLVAILTVPARTQLSSRQYASFYPLQTGVIIVALQMKKRN
jgi:hypothetical protein